MAIEAAADGNAAGDVALTGARSWGQPNGGAEEVKPIRHRLAHCRRPHNDDVARIEQLLRDLEPGACSFLRSYAQWGKVSLNATDPVARAWIGLDCPEAHDVKRGRNNKGIEFTLCACALLGAPDSENVTGTPGWFWVMRANLSAPGTGLYIDDSMRNQSVQNLLSVAAHVIQPSQQESAVTVPAVGEPEVIATPSAGSFVWCFRTAIRRQPVQRASRTPQSSTGPSR